MFADRFSLVASNIMKDFSISNEEYVTRALIDRIAQEQTIDMDYIEALAKEDIREDISIEQNLPRGQFESGTYVPDIGTLTHLMELMENQRFVKRFSRSLFNIQNTARLLFDESLVWCAQLFGHLLMEQSAGHSGKQIVPLMYGQILLVGRLIY